MQKVETRLSRKYRKSSIELLKIVGILLIVISHVVETLHVSNNYIAMNDFILDISTATTNIQYLILAIFQYSGSLGNSIFFVCSAWFLLDSDKSDAKKILHMLMDVWTVSIIILIVVYVIKCGAVPLELVIRQIFPTTFENNWYITCYLLFYPLHTFLNLIIKKIDQKTLLKITLVMLGLYVGVNFIISGSFFWSKLVLWVALYFAIAYMKYYLADIANKVSFNILVLGISCVGLIGLVCLTNFLGLHIEIFSLSLLKWKSNCNPFLILIAISMLNIARNVHFESKIVNYVSSLSLLIYIFHENQLLKIFYRPQMWSFVYHQFGYDYILIWMFILVVIVFLFGLIASIVYKHTIGKIVSIVCNRSFPALQRMYRKIEENILKLH